MDEYTQTESNQHLNDIENNHEHTDNDVIETMVSNDVENVEVAEPYFNPLEARVIGALMEKHLTTPQNYPLTTNSLLNACNQKSNREPVMKLTEGQIGHTVNGLVDRGLAGIDYGERANKITHRVCKELDIDRKQQAILTVMLLRSSQTLNDIKTRTARMVEFEDNNDIQDTINAMIHRDTPLAVLIPKGSGRREERYTHLLCGEVDVSALEKEKLITPLPEMDSDRLDAIEARLAVIEEKLGISLEI